MKIGFTALILAYVLSQFYRAFLAVLTPVLGPEIGTTAADLSFASGLWFIVFAAMQIPVGIALDRVGPRLTAALMLAFGGAGGAIVFANATGPAHISIAMALFGIGCAPVLMASYYLFARLYPPAIFATLAGATIGVGSIGNLASSAPLAYTIAEFGWRNTMWAMAVISALVALGIFLFVRDPERVISKEEGKFSDLLRIPNLMIILPLMAVCYAPVAGLRGLWAGPYFNTVHGLDEAGIGQVTFVMALFMALGSFLYGPAERMLGSIKKTVILGNAAGVLLVLTLWLVPITSWVTAAAIFALIGIFGVSFPALIAHGRSFVPAHLTGRGITLLNLFSIGGVGLFQFITSAMAGGDPGASFYPSLFALFGLAWAAGLVVYLFSQDA